MPILKRILRKILSPLGRKEKLQRLLSGSAKDPLFYLGMFALGLFLLGLFLPRPIVYNLLSNVSSSPSLKADTDYSVIGPTSKVFQTADFYLVQKNSLKAVLPPNAARTQVLAALTSDGQEVDSNRSGIIEYTVKEGDSLWSISQEFNISVETILWANNLTKSATLSAGKKLVILPLSGVMHLVGAGETLNAIVKKYKGDLQETISFNELDNENEVFIGDIVIIPDGVFPQPSVPSFSPIQIAVPDSYFICPIGGVCRRTQGLHWYNAVDLSHGQCWEPIYAAAGGTVQKVRVTSSTSRWVFGGAGNHLTILHPNGAVTFYGHLASILVGPGQIVSQGQVIAYMGGAQGMSGAGLSTGCHLHFEVIGAKNPFIR
jgi:LysM repeat protein